MGKDKYRKAFEKAFKTEDLYTIGECNQMVYGACKKTLSRHGLRHVRNVLGKLMNLIGYHVLA